MSKAEEMYLGTKTLGIDGTTKDISDLSEYNSAMQETSSIDSSKTVGEYLGLTAEQVQNGIFC